MTDGDNQSPFALSVVIIGRNEGERLVCCIQSVRNMKGDFSKSEIIYVDSASTDGSPEKARSLGARVIVLQGKGLSAAKGRNAGWRAASSEYILFLDGDTELEAGFVKSARKEFEAPHVAAVCGRNREKEPEKNFFHRTIDQDWFYPVGEEEYFGGNALVHRRVLEEVGGYNETLTAGEEPELCGRIRKNGWRILRLDIPMAFHDIHMSSWQQYWNRIERTGCAYAEVADRFPSWAPPSWTKKVRKILFQMGTASAITIIFFVWMIAASSFIPPVLWGLLLLCLLAKNIHQCARRGLPWGLSALCGAHWVFSKIPLCVGMLSYYGKKRKENG